MTCLPTLAGAMKRTSAMREHLHLTEPDPVLAALIRSTPPGMAHWSGTGPIGAHCVQCRWWRSGTQRCGEFVRLVRATGVRNVMRLPVPGETAACRHFDLATERQLQRRGIDAENPFRDRPA